MIYKYLIHFVSVRDNQNVNVEYLIMVTTCNKILNSDFKNSSITTQLFFSF